MAKTNFTKAEEALAEGMRKMTVQKLLDETKQAAQQEDVKPSQKIIKQLIRDLNMVMKNDKQLFLVLGFNKDQIKKILSDPTNISADDWKTLLDFKKMFDMYKSKKKREVVNDRIVEEERQKHINKRFNVNEKWLPLQ